MEVVDVLRVANKIKLLALDVENQPVIVRRGVLPSLITFLQNDNIQVRIVASDTIRLLSSHADNKQLLSQDAGLVAQVCSQFKLSCNAQEGTQEAVLKSNMTDIVANLSDHLNEEQMQAAGLSLKDIIKTLRVKEQQLAEQKQAKKHNVVIEIEELKNGESARLQVQKIILAAKGTISYTISVPEKRANIYTRATTEKLLELLQEKKFTCSIVQDAICETEYRSKNVTSKKQEQEDKENREPKYLSPEKKKQDQLYKNSLVSHGDSYEQRLAQQRAKKENSKQAKKEDEGSVTRFFTKISSVFW